jgi:hypothetical protein
MVHSRGRSEAARILTRSFVAKGNSGRQESRWRASSVARRNRGRPTRSAKARSTTVGAALVGTQPCSATARYHVGFATPAERSDAVAGY